MAVLFRNSNSWREQCLSPKTMAPPLHVVMLPWSAFGHMIPFFQLSVAWAKAGIRVSYVSTPRNIQRLPRIPQSLEDLLTYEEIPMPKVEGLPQESEATVDVEFEQIQYLKVAYDLLEEPFSRIVATHDPDWIVTDFASHWVSRVKEKFGVPHMFFSVFNAAASSFLGPKEYLVLEGQRRVRSNPESLMRKPSWIPFPSSIALRPYEATGFHVGLYRQNASGITDAERIASILEGCQAVAIRSCREFEGDYIDLYKSLIQKPVVPTSLLPAEASETTDQSQHGAWIEIIKWLDEQMCRSVVFIGFGSEYKLTKEEVHEIAFGIESSRLPFLWALRRPSWAAEDSEALPEGFRDRTSARGIVSIGWVPQQKILAHPSVGGFLFHSGWGSTIEGLQYGLTLVVLPFIIDQGLNARLLVEKSLAIVVERTEDGLFSKDNIAQALSKAMVKEEGNKIRENARYSADVFGNAELHQEYYIGSLIEYMKNATRKPSI